MVLIALPPDPSCLFTQGMVASGGGAGVGGEGAMGAGRESFGLRGEELR